MNIAELIKELPKVDLHCHLDGSVRPETLLQAAIKHKFNIPTTELTEFKKYVQVSDDCQSLTEFLDKFEFFYEFLKFPDVVEQITYELCEDAARENIKRLELRFVPYLQSSEKFPSEEVLKTVLNAVATGSKDFDISVGVILCIYRNLSDEINWETVKLAEKYYGLGVVGVDLAGDELRFSTEKFTKFMKFVKDRKIPLTCHVGEARGPESIKEALQLGTDRLGHAVNLLQDKNLCREVKERKIPIEICLTSNVQTKVVNSYETHPFKNFYSDGLKLTLNTDDRSVSNIDLSHEYRIAVEKYNFTIDDLKKLILNAIDAAFLSVAEKERLKLKIQKEMAIAMNKLAS